MKKKFLLLFVVIFVVFLTVGCDKKDNDEIKSGEIKESKPRELTKEEIKDLMDRINVLQYIDYFAKDLKNTDLTNQEALQISFDIASLKGIEKYKFKDLEKIANDYLGFSLEPEDLLCVSHFNVLGGSEYIMLYDSTDGIYKYNDSHLGHGAGGFGADVYNKYADSEVKDDVYTINVYKVFSDVYTDVLNDEIYYYRTYNDAIKLSNHLFKIDIDFNSYDKTADPWRKIDEVPVTDLIKYTYTFVKKGDSYVFTSYKIAK